MRLYWLVLAAALSGCIPQSEEQVRAPSPSGDIEAVVIRTGYGGTVRFYYEVSLDPRGPGRTVKVADYYGLATDGLSPVWLDDRTLELRFSQARDGGVTDASVEMANRTVSVRERGRISMREERLQRDAAARPHPGAARRPSP